MHDSLKTSRETNY